MTAARTMFDKIWDAHVVAEGPGGQTLLFIDTHLMSPAMAAAAAVRGRLTDVRALGA